MQPQASRVMQRFVHTPAGRAVAQLLIVWLVLQPVWAVSQQYARDQAPLPALVAWVWALVRPGVAHAAIPVAAAWPERTLPSTRPLGSTVILDGPASQEPAGAPLASQWYGSLPLSATRSTARSAMPFSLLLADASHTQPRDDEHDHTHLTGTVAVFGPKDYVRDQGKPVVVTDTFSIAAPTATYTLHLDNGGLHGQ